MIELKNDEMKRISGGVNPVLVSSVIGLVITFFMGAFHGYTNPESCRN